MKTLMSYRKGYKPKASEMKTGQLAVNFVDRAIYGRTDDGRVIQLGYLIDPTGETTEGIHYSLEMETLLVVCNSAWNPVKNTLDFTLFQIQPDGSAVALTTVPADMRITFSGCTGCPQLDAGDTIPSTLDISGTKSATYKTIVNVFDLLDSDVVPFIRQIVGYVAEGADGGDGSDGSDGSDGCRGSLKFSYDLMHGDYDENYTGAYNRPITNYRKTGDTSWLSVGSYNYWYEFMAWKLPSAVSSGGCAQVFGDQFQFQLYNTTSGGAEPVNEIWTMSTESRSTFYYNSWDYNIVFFVNGSMIVAGTIYSEAIATGAITSEKLATGFLDIASQAGVDNGGNGLLAKIADTGNSQTLDGGLEVGIYCNNPAWAGYFINGHTKPTMILVNAGTTCNGANRAPILYGGSSPIFGSSIPTHHIELYNNGDIETDGHIFTDSSVRSQGSYLGYSQENYPDIAAWVKFNGNTLAKDSYRGTISITDLGVGHYRITVNNKSHAQSNKLLVQATGSLDSGGGSIIATTANITTNSVEITLRGVDGNPYDRDVVTVLIIGEML